MMRRQGHRAEANTILAVAAVYFVYNSGLLAALRAAARRARAS